MTQILRLRFWYINIYWQKVCGHFWKLFKFYTLSLMFIFLTLFFGILRVFRCLLNKNNFKTMCDKILGKKLNSFKTLIFGSTTFSLNDHLNPFRHRYRKNSYFIWRYFWLFCLCCPNECFPFKNCCHFQFSFEYTPSILNWVQV